MPETSLFYEKFLPRFGFGFGFGFGDFLDSDSAESQHHGFGRPLTEPKKILQSKHKENWKNEK